MSKQYPVQYETTTSEYIGNATVAKSRSIAEQSEALDSNVGELIDAITQLEVSIGTVLAPASPSPASDSLDSSVPHTSFLMLQNQRIRYAIQTVRDLTARVEL